MQREQEWFQCEEERVVKTERRLKKMEDLMKQMSHELVQLQSENRIDREKLQLELEKRKIQEERQKLEEDRRAFAEEKKIAMEGQVICNRFVELNDFNGDEVPTYRLNLDSCESEDEGPERPEVKEEPVDEVADCAASVDNNEESDDSTKDNEEKHEDSASDGEDSNYAFLNEERTFRNVNDLFLDEKTCYEAAEIFYNKLFVFENALKKCRQLENSQSTIVKFYENVHPIAFSLKIYYSLFLETFASKKETKVFKNVEKTFGRILEWLRNSEDSTPMNNSLLSILS